MEKKESLKKIANIYRVLEREIESLKDLDLTKESKKSRVTYSNPHRVVALELRKHYILVHSPQLKYLKDFIEEKENKKFLKEFILTKDSRDFTYIRIYSLTEVPRFLEALKIFNTHNH